MTSTLRRFAFALVVAAAAGGSVRAGAEETIRGQSKDLAISILSEAGDKWCEPIVRIRLDAKDKREFTRDFVAFQQMVGRIRAIVQPRCQTAEGIRFSGRVGDTEVAAGEMLRLTNWRYVPLDPKAPTLPLCTAQLDQAGTCETRRQAYRITRDLFEGDAYGAMRFTTFLDADTPSDLEWKSDKTVGKVNVLARSDIPAGYDTAAALADRIMADWDDACRADHGTPAPLTPAEITANLVARGLRCRGTKPEKLSFMVLAMARDYAYVFSVAPSDGDETFARSVMARVLDGSSPR